VGLVEDVRVIPGAWRDGDLVYVAGSPEVRLDGSEYQARFLGDPAGRPALPKLVAEAALIGFLAHSAPFLTSSHDAAEGGLAVALAESALFAGIGASVELPDDGVAWFGEGGGQAVITCRPENAARLDGAAVRKIGVVGGDKLLGVPLPELAAAHEGGLA
jgi:phosphoribosylformylglycinamidine synthase subunit PurL